MKELGLVDYKVDGCDAFGSGCSGIRGCEVNDLYLWRLSYKKSVKDGNIGACLGVLEIPNYRLKMQRKCGQGGRSSR